MTTPQIKAVMSFIAGAGINPAEMYWFDLSGLIGDQDKADLEPLMTYKPPFEKNMVVWRGHTRNHPDYAAMMLVVGSDPEEGVVVSMWKGAVGARPYKMPVMFYRVVNGQIQYGGAGPEEQDIEKGLAELILANLGCWYRGLAGSSAAYKPEVKQTFTNRRKIAQGKTPTYDWHTVIIGPTHSKQEHQGGTHASPRLHDRRGHLRHLRTGKNVWVKSCKVGDAERGTIFHDYKIIAKEESVIND